MTLERRSTRVSLAALVVTMGCGESTVVRDAPSGLPDGSSADGPGAIVDAGVADGFPAGSSNPRVLWLAPNMGSERVLLLAESEPPPF